MKKMLVLFSMNIGLATSAFSGDIMIERMQSVVDEVSDLRLRYESSVRKNKECLDQLQEQKKVIKKISMDEEGVDYKIFEENRKRLDVLEAENKRLQEGTKADQKLQEIQKELKALEKENLRLSESAEILKEKNKSLTAQINEMKGMQEKGPEAIIRNLEIKVVTLKARIESYESREAEQKVLSSQELLKLKADKKRLEKELIASVAKECKPRKKAASASACLDDNPFPKLMMKKGEDAPSPVKIEKIQSPNRLEEEPLIDLTSVEDANTSLRHDKAGTYRVKQESSVYDAPEGRVIEIWEDKTSFTSNISQGEWIKITGYFIDKKWHKNTTDMWVKEEHTLKR